MQIRKRRRSIEFGVGEVKWSMSVAVFNTWDYGPFCVQPARSISKPRVRHPSAAMDIQIKPAEAAPVHSGNQQAISKRRINGGDEERGNRAGGGTKRRRLRQTR